MSRRIRRLAALVACVFVLGPASPVPAQTAAIHYVYDDLNRLVAVVDQQGNAATYTYDAVGSLLRIDRYDTSAIAGEVGITLVTPTRGRIGAEVKIFGKGFGASVADNTVSFNGVTAPITRAAPNRLVVTVPTGATTGFITVTSPRGSGRSPGPFVVLSLLGPMTIAPGARGSS